MAEFNDYSPETLEAARRFFQLWEDAGKPEDIRSVAAAAEVSWSTAWRWVTLTRPRYVKGGYDWPYDNLPNYMASDPTLTSVDNTEEEEEEGGPYEYTHETDIYLFEINEKPYPIAGEVVRAICRGYSNYDGAQMTVAEVAAHTSMPQSVIKKVLRALKHTHASGPRTPEELMGHQIDDLVDEDLETKKNKYDTVFQNEDLKALKRDAEAYRRAEYVHQRRMQEWGDRIEELRKNYAPPILSLDRSKIVGDHLLDLSLSDLHYGKLAEEELTGHLRYDREIALRRAEIATEKILNRASVFGVEKILFELGNDLFHVDNTRNTTTKGTPQDVDGMALGHFDQLADFTCQLVDMLLQVAPVDIISVPGNHDFERAHYLAVLLAKLYKEHPHITVDATAHPRKYYNYGVTLLGKAHGDGTKDQSLPVIMSVEAAQYWTKAKYREFHVSHLHMREHKEFPVQRSFNGVRIRRKPSPSIWRICDAPPAGEPPSSGSFWPSHVGST